MVSVASAVKDSVRWMALGRFTAQLISWVATLWVIRLLQPADYGLLAMAMVFTVLADRLRGFGLEAYIVRVADLSDDVKRSVVALALALNGAVAGALLVSAPAVGALYGEAAVVPLIQVLTLRYAMQVVSLVPEATVTREMRFRVKAVVDMVSAVVHSAVTLTLAFLGHGVWALVVGMLVGEGTRALAYFVIYPGLYRPRLAPGVWRAVLSFGGYSTGASFGNYLIAQAPKFLLGKFSSKEEVGLYSVAMQIATLPMTKIMTIVAEVAYAAFARLQGKPEEAERNYLKAMTLVAFVGFPLFWGLASVAPTLVPVVLGEAWSEAVLPIAMVSLVMPFQMMFKATSPAVVALDGPKVPFQVLVWMALAMVLGFAFSVQWGAVGATLVWAVLYPFLFIYAQRAYLRVLGISVAKFYQTLMRPILIALPMALLVLLVEGAIRERAGDLWTLLLSVALGAAVYGAATLRWQPDNLVLAWGMVRR